jgi:predicted ArsR family transcriptional regulator
MDPQTDDTMSESTKKRSRIQVDIDPDIKRKIDLIAAALQISPPSWLNNRLKTLVEDEYVRVMRGIGLAPLSPPEEESH